MASVFLKTFNTNFTLFFFNNLQNKIYKDSNFIWDNFIFGSLNFFFKTNDFTNKLFININKKDYYNHILGLLLNFTNFFFFYELAVNKHLNYLALNTLFLCFLTNLNVNFICSFFKDIHSISNIFTACVWAEREAKEINNIFFNKLQDSRRLLTDYHQTQLNLKDYKTTSYFLKNQIVLKICYIDFLFFLIFYFVY